VPGFGHGSKRLAFHRPGSAWHGQLPPPPPPIALVESPDVHDCYQRAVAADRTLAVAATFDLELDARGNVAAATVSVPELPSLEPCLERAALALPRAPELTHAGHVAVTLNLAPHGMQQHRERVRVPEN
jgi:hypothetical protein